MKSIHLKSSLFSLLISISFVSMGYAQSETKLMQQPALSNTHIAFVYAEDLWVANRDGSNPRRLTVVRELNRVPYFPQMAP